jgi:hypothetical protein
MPGIAVITRATEEGGTATASEKVSDLARGRDRGLGGGDGGNEVGLGLCRGSGDGIGCEREQKRGKRRSMDDPFGRRFAKEYAAAHRAPCAQMKKLRDG